MLENPVAALDLPPKLIAWEDDVHKVWYAFNDALYLQERYALPQALAGTLDLNAVTIKALGPDQDRYLILVPDLWPVFIRDSMYEPCL